MFYFTTLPLTRTLSIPCSLYSVCFFWKQISFCNKMWSFCPFFPHIMPLMPKVTVKANRLRQDLHYCKCEWIRSCGTLSQSLKYQPYLRRTVISSLRVSGKKKKKRKKGKNVLLIYCFHMMHLPLQATKTVSWRISACLCELSNYYLQAWLAVS